MFTELMLRFLLGGAVVSVFALCGSCWQPKTFAGLFGAAPSVAVVSLALAFSKQGSAYVATETRSMLIGALALIVYSSACMVVAKRRSVAMGVGAGLAWLIWTAVALGLFFVLQQYAVVCAS
jgi:uncharacterized membrane protein (GlpM family)